MTTKKIMIALAAAAMFMPVMAQNVVPTGNEAETIARRYGANPGPVVAGSAQYSQLPELAREFVNRHYKNVKVVKVEREFMDNSYDVELANGVDMDFNAAGQLTSIEASDDAAPLSEKVVKDVLPSKAFKELKKLHLQKNVEEIKFKNGRVYEIDTRTVSENEYSFDIQENVFRNI